MSSIGQQPTPVDTAGGWLCEWERRRDDDPQPLAELLENVAAGVRSKRLRQRVTACAAVGLSYWADHPDKNCVWAVDDCQHAHVVRIDYRCQTAVHACRDDEAVPYTVPDTDTQLQLGDTA